MRGSIRTGGTVPSAQATRTDLLLGTLALRQQLGVLARSHRRFRPTDRLLWLLLRWLWPRWREALVLVRPATVDRWCREGIRRCWRRGARGPGRPRIDSSCRDLIRRMAAENCLWGAPRIHGELLKLGIAISERTVSRYLRCRSPRRSQTWRTFFANHLGDPTLTSAVMSADARGDDIVVDASDVSSRTTQLPINGSCVSAHRAVDCALPLQSTLLGMHLRQDHLQDRGDACKRRGRDPPPLPWLPLRRRPATGSFRVRLEYLCDRRHREGYSPARVHHRQSGVFFARNRIVNVVARRSEYWRSTAVVAGLDVWTKRDRLRPRTRRQFQQADENRRDAHLTWSVHRTSFVRAMRPDGFDRRLAAVSQCRSSGPPSSIG